MKPRLDHIEVDLRVTYWSAFWLVANLILFCGFIVWSLT